MSEAVPVADAMEEAQAVIDADTLAAIGDVKAAASSDAPVQVPLFEPPPFDFEEAYDELLRLDQRAKNRKAAWESLKSAARDAKEDYDSAINDLHDKFDEIDSARRVAAAKQAPPSTVGATKGGDAQVGEPTEIEQPQPDEEPTPETDAPAD